MPYALFELSESQLEALAASIEPGELKLRAEPGSFPPSFVASRSLELASRQGDTPRATTYLIVRNTDYRFVGSCGFKSVSVAGRAEVGYGVALVARGQGAATAALNMLVRIALDAGAREVLAEVPPGNTASTLVVQKAGFVQVGSRTDESNAFVLQWLRRSEA